jgi:hypothetical protein
MSLMSVSVLVFVLIGFEKAVRVQLTKCTIVYKMIFSQFGSGFLLKSHFKYNRG